MNNNDRQIINRSKLQELINQIDPSYAVDPEVEDLLLEIADDFIENVATFGCALAKHRGSDTLETRDLQLHLEKNWDIRVPGFAFANDDGTANKPSYRKVPMTDAHKQRLGLVKRSMYQMQKQEQRRLKKQQQKEQEEQQGPNSSSQSQAASSQGASSK